MSEFISYFVTFTDAYYAFTLWFFLAVNVFYLLIMVLGFLNARRQHAYEQVGIMNRLDVLKSIEPVSILVPCYNEEATVFDSVSAMLQLDYPEYEVIAVNDGSRDQTLDILLDHFQLYEINARPPMQIDTQPIHRVFRSRVSPNLLVIDKANGGKADALNAAINFSQFPLICCVDSDSVLEADGLKRVVMPFITNESTIATGGTILTAYIAGVGPSKFGGEKVFDAHTSWSWLGLIQAVEYLRAFLVGRLGWDRLRCDMIISGAFGVFKKSLVVEVGGYLTQSIGEDMELVLRMQRHCLIQRRPYVVKLLPDPVCWTEAPSDLRTLGNQRRRWVQGLAESLWANRSLFFRSWSGRLGWIGAPYYLLYELLSAPVELFCYILIITSLLLGVADIGMIVALLAVTVLFGCVLNLFALVIDQLTFQKYVSVGDVFRLTLAAFAEHFGYRQLHLIWRVQGLIRWLRGGGHWGEMKRSGGLRRSTVDYDKTA